MTRHYSALSVLKEGLSGQKGWAPTWRHASPQKEYDAIVIGGGGHGLATAYYLAKTHGLKRVALIEKGWLGGGNTGRNTTVIRSNYFYPESAALFDMSLRLYEGLSRELNYNLMFSQRGMMVLAHSEGEMEIAARSTNAMQLNGVDAELLSRAEVQKRAPILNFSREARFPIWGAVNQPRAGIARHDAVAWAYARAADALGVDICETCEVTGFVHEAGQLAGVETTKGEIRAPRIGMAVAGQSSHLMTMLGAALPLRTYTLQAFVSEPVKPIMDTVAFSPKTGTYFSQSDKGEMVFGGALDRVPGFTQRGNPPVMEAVIAGLLEMAPSLSHLRMLRHWAGAVDVTPDSSPIIGPVGGVMISCGWGTGGFKAIPAGGVLLAHLLATGDHHPVSLPFDISRFARGALIDEGAASGIAH
jgi:heterotetrameric sarcosine oxidase beta subunit